MPRTSKIGTRVSRRLRRDVTPAERRLWWHLERLPVPETHWRRQVPIGRHIVDFACHGRKIVVEVDGAQHGFEGNAAHDQERTRWLEGQGYTVLRFWNGDVMRNVESVLATIHALIESSASPGRRRADTPTPNPSPQGGGET